MQQIRIRFITIFAFALEAGRFSRALRCLICFSELTPATPRCACDKSRLVALIDRHAARDPFDARCILVHRRSDVGPDQGWRAGPGRQRATPSRAIRANFARRSRSVSPRGHFAARGEVDAWKADQLSGGLGRGSHRLTEHLPQGTCPQVHTPVQLLLRRCHSHRSPS